MPYPLNRQLGEVIPVVGEPAQRPHHPVPDLVADLHHLRHDAGLPEGANRVGRPLAYRVSENFDIGGVPCSWNRLLLRISPAIGVVVVEQEPEPGLDDPTVLELDSAVFRAAKSVRRSSAAFAPPALDDVGNLREGSTSVRSSSPSIPGRSTVRTEGMPDTTTRGS